MGRATSGPGQRQGARHRVGWHGTGQAVQGLTGDGNDNDGRAWHGEQRQQ
jgi:hypothetical protein